MAKAFPDEINELLRALARRVMETQFHNKQNAMAAALSLTPGFISDFLGGNRGAGLDLLRGLGQFAPLELLEILKIDPRVISTLWVESGASEGKEMRTIGGLPSGLKRAARAAVELMGCSPFVAAEAAEEAFALHGTQNEDDAEWWFLKIRDGVVRRTSGVRPAVSFKVRSE